MDYSKYKLNLFKKIYFSQFILFGNDSTYLHGKDKKKVLILMIVATLVMMIALVNFINISSSQWMGKINQTGVKKVIGARRSTILKQMISEASFLFILALILDMVIVNFISPLIRNYTGIQFSRQILNTPWFLVITTAGTILLSIVFSIVPASRISSSNAVDNLKKTIHPGNSKSFLRGILVTAQFVIAIVLIAFTLLVQKQVYFGSNSLGFNQKNILEIKLTPQLNDKKDVLKKMLQEKSVIGKISFAQYYPGKPMSH